VSGGTAPDPLRDARQLVSKRSSNSRRLAAGKRLNTLGSRIPERIFLTYTNATAMPYLGSPRAHHVVVNYVDSDGVHYRVQGLPERTFEHNFEKAGAFIREEGGSSGAENRDSPFGRLLARPERAIGGTFDGPITLIADGENLRSQWNRMLDFSNRVNSNGYEYRPYSQNSNSFAASALKHAGLLGPGTATPKFSIV